MRNETIEAIGPDRRRLRLEFARLNDRYAQRISLIAADGAIQPLLESVEGSPHDDWPSSPPLQSLTIETRGDHVVALLVGMAGGSHWSASIEAVAGKAELIFDIACRHGAKRGALGSRYRRVSGAAKELAIRGEGANISLTDDGVAIRPADGVDSPGTTRWRFTLST